MQRDAMVGFELSNSNSNSNSKSKNKWKSKSNCKWSSRGGALEFGQYITDNWQPFVRSLHGIGCFSLRHATGGFFFFLFLLFSFTLHHGRWIAEKEEQSSRRTLCCIRSGTRITGNNRAENKNTEGRKEGKRRHLTRDQKREKETDKERRARAKVKAKGKTKECVGCGRIGDRGSGRVALRTLHSWNSLQFCSLQLPRKDCIVNSSTRFNSLLSCCFCCCYVFCVASLGKEERRERRKCPREKREERAIVLLCIMHWKGIHSHCVYQ